MAELIVILPCKNKENLIKPTTDKIIKNLEKLINIRQYRIKAESSSGIIPLRIMIINKEVLRAELILFTFLNIQAMWEVQILP